MQTNMNQPLPPLPTPPVSPPPPASQGQMQVPTIVFPMKGSTSGSGQVQVMGQGQLVGMCQHCNRFPKSITAQGHQHPFCSKTCARDHLKQQGRVRVKKVSAVPRDLCRGCGNPCSVVPDPSKPSTFIQHTHCSKSCALRWPLTTRVCALDDCEEYITGAMGQYCSVGCLNLSQITPISSAHSSASWATPSPSPSPSPSTSKMGNSYSSNLQPPSKTSGASWKNLFKRGPIRFYDKADDHYGFTNFSNHPIVYQRKTYPTSEHLFQALKFLDHKPQVAEHIRTHSDQPRSAFAEARKFQKEARPDWGSINIQMMDKVLKLKFSQHKDLKEELLKTGDRELIEDSPVDAFWGVGQDGTGKNELGKALMRLRQELQAQAQAGK